MDSHTFPLAEEEKQKLDAVQSDLRAQPVTARTRDLLRANPSWVWTGVALVGAVAACMVTRLFTRR